MKIQSPLLALFAACLSLPLFAQDDAKKETQKEEKKKLSISQFYLPRKIPDRIALTFADDPATSACVTWRSSVDGQDKIAEIAEATGGPEFVVKKRAVKTKTQKIEFRQATSYYHTAKFNGLKPNTKYLYRVGNKSRQSEWSEFKTATKDDSSFSFVYFGDAQNAIKAMWSRVSRRGIRDMPNAAFFLHAGDLINAADRDEEWGEWFYAGGWINRSIPIVATPGNHEYSKNGLSIHWRPNFELPQNGPKGLEESAYYFDYQGTRFVSLNTNRKLEEQAKWLDKILTNNPSNWTILFGHHPFYSPAKSRDNPKLRELFAPVFAKHRVDLCLQGHDHSYSRSFQTNLQTDFESAPSRHIKGGTVFAVSVSGPKMYGAAKKKVMQRVAEGTQLYQLVTVEKEKIHFKAMTAAGDLYDEFILTRKEDAVQITDLTPKTPERRFKNINFDEKK